MYYVRTDSRDQHFINLVKLLDKELAIRDGKDHAFYDQFNSLEDIKHVVLGFYENEAVACGAFKQFEENCVEIKRMYTKDEFRNQTIGSSVLMELEYWAAELGNTRFVLETGIKQPEAIALYTKSGYKLIPNYGQYVGVEASVCFEKG